MVPYRKIFQELEERKIRYLVAGGFAVNFHGAQRFTADLDLIIHLQPSNTLALIDLMKTLGYKPRLPVDPKDFANKKKRSEWIEQKGMLVFSYIHPSNPFELIDIFVKEPKPFAQLWRRRLEVRIQGAKIKVLSKSDLIELKLKAGRPRDLLDVQELKKKKR